MFYVWTEYFGVSKAWWSLSGMVPLIRIRTSVCATYMIIMIRHGGCFEANLHVAHKRGNQHTKLQIRKLSIIIRKPSSEDLERKREPVLRYTYVFPRQKADMDYPSLCWQRQTRNQSSPHLHPRNPQALSMQHPPGHSSAMGPSRMHVSIRVGRSDWLLEKQERSGLWVQHKFLCHLWRVQQVRLELERLLWRSAWYCGWGDAPVGFP